MPRIDDPLDAIQSQYPEEPQNQLVDLLMAVAGSLSPFAGIVSAIKQHFSQEGQRERLKVLLETLVSEVRRHGKQIEDISSHFRSPEATEAFIVAVTQAILTPNREKIKRFAAVLGSEACSEEGEKSWEDAAAFIRDLAQLGDSDIEALQILDVV